MLAEYGFPLHQHGTSPWSREHETIFDETDLRLPGLDDVQIEIQSIELHGDIGDEIPHETLSLFGEDDTCSLSTSHLSSEFDDDVNRSNHGEDSPVMFETDLLTNCLINNLPDVCLQDDDVVPDGFDNFSILEIPVAESIEVVSDDGSHEISSSQSSKSNSSISGSPSLPRKRRRNIDDIPWSELSYNERQTLLESISIKVSDVLGPREQLELLRIIDPDIQSLPQDGQFTIEPDFLDNDKVEKIKKLIESNTIRSNPPSIGSSSQHSSKHRQTRGDATKLAQKKKQTKERRNQLKPLRQKRRKDYKQNMKEKRSGLFAKEEVLALESFTEEDEVDILG